MGDALLILCRSSDVFSFILRSSSEPNSMKLPFLLGKSEGSSSLVRRNSGGRADDQRTSIGLTTDFQQRKKPSRMRWLFPYNYISTRILKTLPGFLLHHCMVSRHSSGLTTFVMSFSVGHVPRSR